MTVTLARQAWVDVLVEDGTGDALLWSEGDLLEGVRAAAAPGFESCLVVQRHRLSASCKALARRAAVRLLADGAPVPAPRRSTRGRRRAAQPRRLAEDIENPALRALAAAGPGPG